MVMLLGIKNVKAATVYWNGSSNTSWNNAGNWSMGSVPGISDDVVINGATNMPDVNISSQCASLTVYSTVTITLDAPLTVSGGLVISSGTLTMAGASSASFGGASSIVGNCKLSAGAIALTFTASLTVSSGGAMTLTGSTVNIGAIGSINNQGTVTAYSSTFTLTAGASITNAGGDFTLNTSSITGSGSVANTSGTFTLDNSSTITTTGAISISNSTSGVFTVRGGSSITIPSGATGACPITNSGTFFAGVSGYPCIINLNSLKGTITNSSGGSFFLGPTSILNVKNGATVTNSGTFTIQSDATGSGAIGSITSGTPFSGTYNVERYLSAHRGYRLISAPVYVGTASGHNIYSLNYLYNNLYLTGTSGTGGGFTASGNPTLYLYDEGFTPQFSTFLNSNFIGISSISGGTGATPTYTLNTNGGGLSTSSPYSLPAGTGFLCFFRGNLSEGASNLTNPSFPALSATAVATGTLNTGQVTFTEWYNGSPSLSSTSQNYSLIGNPYPSAIDLETIPTATTSSGIYATPFNSGKGTGVTSFVYELNGITGNYEIYNVANPTFSTSGASEYIASGQAFFVQAYGSSCQFIFNESGKATVSSATATNGLMVTKMPLAAKKRAKADPIIRFNMTLDSLNNDELLLSFNPSAKTQYVINEDAPKKTGQGRVGFSSSSSDGIPMAINVMPLQKSQVISLSVYAAKDGVYTIKMSEVKSLPGIYDIWLMDAYKKDSLDIKNNQTYSFNIYHNDAASFGTKRFSLVIRQNQALGVHLLNFKATKKVDGAEVVWKTENEENYTNFTVERSTDNGATFDVLGGFVSGSSGTYSFVDKDPLATDQYRLKLQDLNGAISYSNVVTLVYGNSANAAAGFISVYPNPASGVINLAINKNEGNSLNTNLPALQNLSVSPGLISTQSIAAIQSYSIKIINIAGSVIKTSTSSQIVWQGNVSNLTPGTYIIQVTNNATNRLVGKSTFVKL